jgi:GWxTD domain-containing protein
MSIEHLGNRWFGLLLLALSLPVVAAQKPAGVISGNPYQKWIDEDARYIITDQEAADFKKLTSDPQRDDFIVTFWERRNPTPGAPRNSFKEEQYRRLAYANTHYAHSAAGYKTDRGRIYILGAARCSRQALFSGGIRETGCRQQGRRYPLRLGALALSVHRRPRKGRYVQVRGHMRMRRISHANWYG